MLATRLASLRDTASRFFLAGVLAAGMGLPASADQPKTFVSINGSTYQSSSNLNAGGQQVPSFCTFNQEGYGIYVSHQMSPRDNWYGDTAYNVISCGGNSTSGLTDIEIGEQHGISGNAHPQQWNIRGSLIFPSGYSIYANPRLGYGRPGATFGPLYIGSWKAGAKHYGFVIASAAVKAYTSYPAPQLNTSFTAGLKVTPGVLLMESYFGTTALGNGGQVTDLGQNPIKSTRYNSYQLTEAATLDMSPNVGLNINVWNLVGGNSIGIGTTVGAGLWIRF